MRASKPGIPHAPPAAAAPKQPQAAAAPEQPAAEQPAAAAPSAARDLSMLDRKALKKYIKLKELNVKVMKKDSDDDIRAKIQNAEAGGAPAADDGDGGEEEGEE